MGTFGNLRPIPGCNIVFLSEINWQGVSNLYCSNYWNLTSGFINTSNRLDPALQSKKIDVGSIADYKIVALVNRVRAIVNLTDSVSYSGEVSGHVYSLIISGKGEQLISPRKEVFITNRPVNARFGITNIDFRGLDKVDHSDDWHISGKADGLEPLGLDLTASGQSVPTKFQYF